MKVEYYHNNSGGTYWLSLEHWKALEAAGWEVEYFDQARTDPSEAIREGLTLSAAISEWASITGQDPYEVGCPCCGPPHEFYEC